MFRIFFAAIAAVFLAQTSLAEEMPNPAIETTIQSQIDAFLADDMTTAFSYASPNIKGIFGSPERFGQMVKQGFPMVYRPSVVEFLELREVSGMLWQKVLMRDLKGVFTTLDYQMVPAGEGWQINAVQIIPNPPVGA